MPTDPEHLTIDSVAQRLSRQFATLDTDLVARVVWEHVPAFRRPPHPGRRAHHVGQDLVSPGLPGRC